MASPAPSISGRQWQVRPPADDGDCRRLAEAAGVHPLVASILLARGEVTARQVAGMVAPPAPGDLHDPFALAGMDQAVDRLLRAREAGERILVHGDYDVDGITSAVLVKRSLDLTAFADTDIFIPHRIDDGYGLNPSVARRCTDAGRTLLVAVDCGTSDLQAIDVLNRAGVDTVILDHHLPGPELPDAVALVNPKRADCRYPWAELCSAGLAFKLAQALHHRLDRPFNAAAWASMAALGTVADLVPLRDENRLIVRLGLEHLRHPVNPGMRALLTVSGVEQGQAPGAGQVGFRLGPRINAAGRLDSGQVAARLFLTGDRTEAESIAHQLDLLNGRRQHQESELVSSIARLVESSPEWLDQRILVVDGEDWPRGVIGIAASRLVETWHRPSAVISSSAGVGHGSCRSVTGFNITAALEAVADGLLDRFGGHAMAAGFSLPAERIPALRRALEAYCRDHLDPELLIPRTIADVEADPGDLDRALCDQLARLEPFGVGNPKPLLLVRGLALAAEPDLLRGGHLKLRLRAGERELEAIWWRSAEWLPGIRDCANGIDILGRLELNRWGGRETVRLSVADARPAANPIDSPR
jgi:single-stranded-DNA-specific exonuclease